MKKIVKYIALNIILLISFWLCGTIVLKIFGILLSIEYTNIWRDGLLVGCIAWLLLAGSWAIKRTKKNPV